MSYSLIITSNDSLAVERLKELKMIGRGESYYRCVSEDEILSCQTVPFNSLFDCNIIDNIFIDCSINCARLNANGSLFNLEAAYIRRAKHTSLGNTNVKIRTFVSQTPVSGKPIVNVTQLPNIVDADPNLIYAIHMGNDILQYIVDEEGFRYICSEPGFDDHSSEQVLGFIDLLRSIALSYYAKVKIVVKGMVTGNGSTCPVVSRDITFDNDTHNIIINI